MAPVDDARAGAESEEPEPSPEARPAGAPWLWRRYQAFMFLGAFLAFALEPLVGRLLLPSSGGGFLVWAITLVFFQGALLVGYGYGHLGSERAGRGHVVALLAALAFLPIGRGLGALASGGASGSDLLGALALSVALPFAVLTSTAIVAQRWLTRTALPQASDPYPLYALSNAGSLAALASYPLLVEPLLGLEAQRWIWSAGYLGYLALGLSLLPRGADPSPTPLAAGGGPAGEERAEAADTAGAAPTRLDLLAWVAASALPSAFLMAVSQSVSVRLGSLPLVWILPLATYLLTFMAAFARQPRLLWVRRLWPELVALGALQWVFESGASPLGSLGVQLGLLFLVGLVAHGALYAARPAARHLGTFYVALALGGWIGGALVAFVAPLLPALEDLQEYPLCLAALPLALALVRRRELGARWSEGRAHLLKRALLPLLLTCAALGAYLYRESLRGSLSFRNYYGVYRVADLQETWAGEPRILRYLIHGTTTHGVEARTTPEELGQPIGYYHPASPLGQAFRVRRPGAVAVVGLGAGALAAYARPEERWVFFELDPLVEDIARGHFTFLPRLEEARQRDPRAPQVEVVIGDARVQLRDQPEGAFALVALDAFSGGAIPTHLLTREALSLYRRKLAPGGQILLHLSSDAYDLPSVAVATAASLDPPLLALVCRKRAASGLYESPATAVILAERLEDLAGLRGQPGWELPQDAGLAPLSPWSDDYTNLLGALWAQLQR